MSPLRRQILELRLDAQREKMSAAAKLARAEELEFQAIQEEASEADDPCPGEHRCHGAQSWCSACGDVRHVCDDPACQVHVLLVAAGEAVHAAPPSNGASSVKNCGLSGRGP